MSQSLLIYLCLGTAFTAVSFFLIDHKSLKREFVARKFWRNQGKIGDGTIVKVVLVFVMPMIVFNFLKDQHSLSYIAIPVFIIATLSLFSWPDEG